MCDCGQLRDVRASETCMPKSSMKILFLISVCVLTSSCGPTEENPPKATHIPLSENSVRQSFTCEDIEANWNNKSTKPLVLEDIGYHSWRDASQDRRNAETQAALLKDAIEYSEG